jgi:hypothetical protein
MLGKVDVSISTMPIGIERGAAAQRCGDDDVVVAAGGGVLLRFDVGQRPSRSISAKFAASKKQQRRDGSCRYLAYSF